MNCVDDIIQLYREAKTVEELSAMGEKTPEFLKKIKSAGGMVPEGSKEGLRGNWLYHRDRILNPLLI